MDHRSWTLGAIDAFNGVRAREHVGNAQDYAAGRAQGSRCGDRQKRSLPRKLKKARPMLTAGIRRRRRARRCTRSTAQRPEAPGAAGDARAMVRRGGAAAQNTADAPPSRLTLDRSRSWRFRHQEGDHVGGLFGAPDAADRHVSCPPLYSASAFDPLAGGRAFVLRGPDQPDAHRVDQDAVRAAYSLDSALVIASPAARVTVVGIVRAAGCLAPMLVTLTIRPPPRALICRPAGTSGSRRTASGRSPPARPRRSPTRKFAGRRGAGVVDQDVDAAEARPPCRRRCARRRRPRASSAAIVCNLAAGTHGPGRRCRRARPGRGPRDTRRFLGGQPQSTVACPMPCEPPVTTATLSRNPRSHADAPVLVAPRTRCASRATGPVTPSRSRFFFSRSFCGNIARWASSSFSVLNACAVRSFSAACAAAAR